jgi:hypothetical protein
MQIQQLCLFSLAKSLQRPNFMLSSPYSHSNSKRKKKKKKGELERGWSFPFFFSIESGPHWLGVPLTRETNAGEMEASMPSFSLEKYDRGAIASLELASRLDERYKSALRI